jgi:alkyl sulfatase BDS1-like metallo-beta-lactamase superfamily hydrolase
LIPPQTQAIAAAPEVTVDYFRVRIDPKKSGDTDKVLLFDFQGDHRTVGLHIRRAVAEFLDDPDEHYRPADVIMSLSGEAWAKLALSQATVQELVKSKEIEMKRGTAEEADNLISLFDKYKPEKAVLVAPHLHD